jgi:hypothetical protein
VQGQGQGRGRSGILGNSNNHCAFWAFFFWLSSSRPRFVRAVWCASTTHRSPAFCFLATPPPRLFMGTPVHEPRAHADDDRPTSIFQSSSSSPPAASAWVNSSPRGDPWAMAAEVTNLLHPLSPISHIDIVICC